MCVLVDTAAAEFLRPLIEEWIAEPPDFDWEIAAGPAAAKVFSEIASLPKAAMATIDPKASAPEFGFEQTENRLITALVVSAASWPAEFTAIRAARRGGLRILQVIDNWYGYRRRLWDGRELVLGDRLLVIDEIAKREAEAEGLPGERLAAVGHPAWEKIGPLAPSTSKDVLFLGAPIARDYGTSLGYTEHDSWAMLQAARKSRPDLFGRVLYAPHPTMDLPDDLGDAEVVRYRRELLGEIGAVAGMFSAPLVEAVLARRRALTLQPGATVVDMCPLSRHGLIPRIGSVEQVIAGLTASPPDPEQFARSLRASGSRVAGHIKWALAA